MDEFCRKCGGVNQRIDRAKAKLLAEGRRGGWQKLESERAELLASYKDEDVRRHVGSLLDQLNSRGLKPAAPHAAEDQGASVSQQLAITCLA